MKTSRFLKWALVAPILCVSTMLSYGRTVLGGGPSLEALRPPIGSRGTEFSVIALGSSLGEVKEVMTYREGLKLRTIQKVSDDEIKLTFSTTPESPLGIYPIRLRSAGGLSELRTITLTPFPIVEETSSESAQLVPMNSTVVGRLEGDAVDTFEVMVEAGQRLSGEVHAVRLGHNLLDTKLTVVDPNGVTILVADDSPLLNQDPSFSWIAKTPGRYRVSIASVGASADADSYYALHLGSFPRPACIFPLGGEVDSNVDLLMHEASKDVPGSKRLAASTKGLALGTQGIELRDAESVCPSPFPFRVSSFPSILEPNVPTTPIEAPCALNGTIGTQGETDTYQFRSPATGLMSVEVFASRFGSLLDSVIEIADANGQIVAQSDDLDSLDSKAEFLAMEGEVYSVSIRDKRKKSGELYVYRIEVSPSKPSLAVFLPRRDRLSQFRQVLEVPAGNRIVGFLGIRKDNVEKPIELRMADLPPGLHFNASKEQPGSFVIPVVLEASQSALEGATLASIYAGHGEERIATFEQFVDLVAGPADALYQGVSVNKLAIAVTKANPFKVELKSPTVGLPVDGTLGIRVVVEREAIFSSPIDVSLPHLPEWIEAPAKIQIGPNETTGVFTIKSMPFAEPLNWNLVAEAMVGVASKNDSTSQIGASMAMPTKASPLDYPAVSSSLHSLRIAPSPCRGFMQAIAAEQGVAREVICDVNFQSAVPKSMVAMIEGLPNRVMAESVKIDETTKQIRFQLNLAADAPIGTFDTIFCRLQGEIDGQEISYCIARNTKLQISAPGVSRTDATGRPLSPLEVLRTKSEGQ
jgi:hypothetical protein